LARQRGVRRIKDASGIPLGSELAELSHDFEVRYAKGGANELPGEGWNAANRAGRATTPISVEDSTTWACFPKVNLERRSRAPPLPGLKELQWEPSGPLATSSLYAREKPKQKPEGLGGKLLKMKWGELNLGLLSEH